MTVALVLLAAARGRPLARRAPASRSRCSASASGWSRQVLVLAVQNSVERRDLGIATGDTGFFRALGGAVGAAVLGAIFAAAAPAAERIPTSSPASRACSSPPRRSPRSRSSPCSSWSSCRCAARASTPVRARRLRRRGDRDRNPLSQKEDDMSCRTRASRCSCGARAAATRSPRSGHRAGRVGRPAAASPRLRRDVLRARGRADFQLGDAGHDRAPRASASSRRAAGTTPSRTSERRPPAICSRARPRASSATSTGSRPS